MFKVKEIKVGTYDNYYKRDIQLQFLNDSKLTEYLQFICESGSNYQNTLKNYSGNYNIENIRLQIIAIIIAGGTIPKSIRTILNTIGGLLGLPPIEYFLLDIDGTPTPISELDYISIIKGQQLKNTWDGTNKGILDNLRTLFPSYEWDLMDDGTMNVSVYIKGQNVSEITEKLFKDGWFTPKPAGVKMSYNVIAFNVFTWDDSTQDDDNNYIKGWENGNWI